MTTTERVLVVGLGDLGLAIAQRLRETGTEVAAVDLAEERRQLWRQVAGEPALASVAAFEAPAGSRVLVCVRTNDQAAAVLDELARLPGAADAVAYLVTTLEPAFARALGERRGPPPVRELAVSGGRDAAASGTLVALLGGPEAGLDDIAFLERTIAARVFAFPRWGDATLAKLLNNALAAFNAYAFARFLLLAEESGVDPATWAAVARAGSGSSWMAERLGGLVDELLVKDAGLLAAELGPLPALDLGDPDAFLAALRQARRRID